MFEVFFSTQSFYFSADYDLTVQFNENLSRGFKQKDHDERFYYNEAFARKLKTIGLESWIQPFINGLVVQSSIAVNQKETYFTLISRRDKMRAGMRFISRGSDQSGNVSNFAETEQIMVSSSPDFYDVFTYLQIRGSIPIVWRQSPSLKWSPKLEIEANKMKNMSAFDNHLINVKKNYGDATFVNLIDKKGSQLKIGQYMTELFRTNEDKKLHYVWFDFHAECKNMKWNNLSKLIAEVKEFIQSYKYGQYRVTKNVRSCDSHCSLNRSSQERSSRTNQESSEPTAWTAWIEQTSCKV